MAIEKTWLAVPAMPLLQNGDSTGLIKVSSTLSFKVKQKIILKSSSQQPVELEIKRINDDIYLEVGNTGKSIKQRTDISQFLVSDSAVLLAIEQPRPAIAPDEYERASYEEEPTVAKRVVLVDALGNKIGSVKDIDGKTRFLVDAGTSGGGGGSTVLNPFAPPTNSKAFSRTIVGVTETFDYFSDVAGTVLIKTIRYTYTAQNLNDLVKAEILVG